jgi:hypothetical protein
MPLAVGSCMAESDWLERATELLRAIQDVAPDDHPRVGSEGSTTHRDLFDQYLTELREAKELAEGWWEALIATEEEDRTGDREQAIANVEGRRPVGPVAHGAIIEVVRKFWLACAALNRQVSEVERVAPEEFVLGWLTSEYQDLAAFLSRLPYWPIGLDQTNWV